MDVTEENLATLAKYLEQTLNPDPAIRRPGKLDHVYYIYYICNYLSYHKFKCRKLKR